MKRIICSLLVIAGFLMTNDLFAQKYIHWPELILPTKDTVILKGSSIQIGGFLKPRILNEITIEGVSKSKKADLEKGYYFVNVQPSGTTTYQFTVTDGRSAHRMATTRTIYVVKSEKERLALEQKIKQSKGTAAGGMSLINANLRVVDSTNNKEKKDKK